MAMVKTVDFAKTEPRARRTKIAIELWKKTILKIGISKMGLYIWDQSIGDAFKVVIWNGA